MSPSLKFQSFHSTAAVFELQAILRKVCWTNPKWPWTLITKLNVWHIYVTSIHESHIFLRYALWPVIFEIQAFVRKVHRMTSKWHWTLQGQIYDIYVTLVSTNPKCQFHYTTSLFWDTGHFETSALHDPKMALLNSKKKKKNNKEKNRKFLEMYRMTSN